MNIYIPNIETINNLKDELIKVKEESKSLNLSITEENDDFKFIEEIIYDVGSEKLDILNN